METPQTATAPVRAAVMSFATSADIILVGGRKEALGKRAGVTDFIAIRRGDYVTLEGDGISIRVDADAEHDLRFADRVDIVVACAKEMYDPDMIARITWP